jgi:hypothetical protein
MFMKERLDPFDSLIPGAARSYPENVRVMIIGHEVKTGESHEPELRE